MLLVFSCIALGCFVLLMISLLVGGDGDVEIDHDFDVDHDADAGGGYHWLSFKVFMAFGTAFGAAGAIARSYDVHRSYSVLIAIAAGLVLAFIAERLVSFFYQQQASSSFSSGELLGRKGSVILGILPGGTGEVQVSIRGGTVSRPARSQDGDEIRQGETVEIVATGSPLTVRKV